MVTIYSYDIAQGILEQPAVEKLPDLLEAENVDLWVDLENPAPEESEILRSVFNFHELAVEDCTQTDIEEAKLDDYEDYLRVRNEIIRKIWNSLRRAGTRLFFRGIHGLSYLDHPDEIVDDNSIILINSEPWHIFPSPGHAPEHISLYSEEKGILFSGDNVLKMRSTWLGPPESNISDYIETIKKLQNLPNLKLILPAHGEIIENPKETLSAIIERMNERQKQVLDAIYNHSEKGLTPDDILNLIYPHNKRFTRIIARDWIV